ncbi:hypothetical protein PN36_15105 [Candidatus Thiomargarita nelsonii]|uniref:Uncharacterized protein n=1 Tax=Candidatus Thiomargarita nelsonii TaxID=1003181 RepID=A0A0A6S6A1_9GAMM|nr:hypothetical protein PN36_15105 [Candidatus Thiomargarita nelsonii]
MSERWLRETDELGRFFQLYFWQDLPLLEGAGVDFKENPKRVGAWIVSLAGEFSASIFIAGDCGGATSP